MSKSISVNDLFTHCKQMAITGECGLSNATTTIDSYMCNLCAHNEFAQLAYQYRVRHVANVDLSRN